MTELYHVVTGRMMEQGQLLKLDDEHPNGVCLRVRALERLERGEDPGELGELIRGDVERWKCVARREEALERVRLSEFPEHPSRLCCLYASRTLDEARSWASYFSELGRDVLAIVRLNALGSVFTGDACNCFDGTGDRATDDELARRYWLALPTGNPVMETLVAGDTLVDEIIERF